MKVAIYLGHPAHFHLFNYTAKNLVSSGHTVSFVIKQKDILKDLLQNAGFKYVTIREEERKKSSKLGLMFSLIKMDFKMLRFLLKDRPDILIGTYVALLGKLSGVPIISINEDDASAVPMFAFTSYPLANAILNPTVCNSGR